jgi:hypothetical protein
MASVLFVSKPIAAPWNDSGKNLVRDLARGMTRHRATVMVRAGDRPDVGNAACKAVYGAPRGHGFAPALVDQARVFAALLASRQHALWHFFFAPNPRSCLAGGLARRLRGTRCVHTISSAPKDPEAIVPQLFADVHVVLSRHTEARLLAAGLAPARMVRIPPAIAPLLRLDPAAKASLRASFGMQACGPLVLYPGDLEFGEGGALLVAALAQLPGTTLVLACRAKTSAAVAAERALLADARRAGLGDRVVSLGETPRIHALLACADVVALPSLDLYAKMDYPLVLLEAMSLGQPVVVARGSAAAELCEGEAALASDATPTALAATLSAVLGDAEGARAIGERARAAVLLRYSHAVMARGYESLYDQLLG